MLSELGKCTQLRLAFLLPDRPVTKMGVPKIQNKEMYMNAANLKFESSISSPSSYIGFKNSFITDGSTCNNIAEFYRDACVFITGATGFVGKAILEKLLRTCGCLDSVYLLIRTKRGMGSEQRLKELLKNPVRVKLG